MKKHFAVRALPADVDSVLLVIRVVCGIAFMMHGWGKIQNPFHWMGDQAPVPGIFQFLAAISEFGGGLAWILGLLTRLASAGIMMTMLVAVYTHRFVMGDPFVNLTGGTSYEPATMFLLFALLLIVVGPGRYSLDRKVFGLKQG